MRKLDVAAITLVAWMLTLSFLMYILGIPDLHLFIAAALTGFFIIVYMIHPVFSAPRYIRNINRMAIACMVLFSLVVVLRILELIGW
ncbi:MAG: hypothetical protein KO206_03675 [Methanomicrobiaceae archaeon]|nr:hypothetical protein [Methanomicrobiaceae archaeon]